MLNTLLTIFGSTILLSSADIQAQEADKPAAQAAPQPAWVNEEIAVPAAPAADNQAAQPAAPMPVAVATAPAAPAPAVEQAQPAASMTVAVVTAPATAAISAEGSASINADVSTYISSVERIDEAFAKYAAERNISYGAPNANGTVYITGKASVIFNVNAPEFIKSRALAYERAYTNALNEIIMDLTGQQMTKTITEHFSDESSNKYQPPNSAEEAAATITAKVNALTDAMLDKGLKQLGIDPAQYGNVPVEKKKVLYKDLIYKQSVKIAAHKATGFLPVNSFEARDEKGCYCIGVVLRYDADCIEIARCIAAKTIPVITRPSGMTVQEVLPNDDELISMFGIRLYFDETGLPSLLSCAQYGSAYTGNNERLRQRSLEHAQEQAMELADMQLTNFINSTITLGKLSELSDNEQESLSFNDMNVPKSEDGTIIIDKLLKLSIQEGSDTMSGRTTVLKKFYTHPSGHKVAVVIRRWSFAQLANVQRILNPAQPVQQLPPAAPAPQPQRDGGLRKSRTYDF